MDVLFVAAEAWPFAKSGGLGDVIGSLPNALKQQGINVRVIMPLYSNIAEGFRTKMRLCDEFKVNLGWRSQYCGLRELEHENVHFYFIDNEYYFKRDILYGCFDDAERYAYFCRAVLKSLPRMDDFRPDILHCHDWHSALIPFMIRHSYKRQAYYYQIHTLFTIHNLCYQGRYSGEVFDKVLGWAGQGHLWEQMEYYGDINFMKAALLTADAISTVSPSYAKEIQTEYYGEGLDGILRNRSMDLHGILNGIDESFYNPVKDTMLHNNYCDPPGKVANKASLQRELGLPEQARTPLFSIVSRLAEPKGIDLLDYVMDDLLQQNVQLVVLGTGEREYENMMRYFASRYPNKMALRLVYDEPLAHRIYAGADMILIPSRLEPCGLTQMIAMRYGTVPIVRETGGLQDTVQPYNHFDGSGNGFSFHNYNAGELLDTIWRATDLYHNQAAAWAQLSRQGMAGQFDWQQSAEQYVELYKQMTHK